jgi:hypothetical protein
MRTVKRVKKKRRKPVAQPYDEQGESSDNAGFKSEQKQLKIKNRKL